MNALVRSLGYASSGRIFEYFNDVCSKKSVLILLFCLFVNSFCIVCNEYYNREKFIVLNNVESKTEVLNSRYNKLLLEDGALKSESRIELIASHFNMVFPRQGQVVYIERNEYK